MLFPYLKEVLTFLLLSIFGNLISVNYLIYADNIKIVFLLDPIQRDIKDDIGSALKDLEQLHQEADIQDSLVVVENDEENSANTLKTCSVKLQLIESFQIEILQDEYFLFNCYGVVCGILTTQGTSVVIDFTYFQWINGLDIIRDKKIPYLRVDRLLSPFLNMFSEFLQQKGANDVALIFQNEQDFKEALYHTVGGFAFRTLLLNADAEASDFIRRLKQIRPSPSYYAIFAHGTNMNAIYKKISKEKLFERPAEWHFVFLDTNDDAFKYQREVEFATKFSLNASELCSSMEMGVSFCLKEFSFRKALLREIFRRLIDPVNRAKLSSRTYECNESSSHGHKENLNILNGLEFSDFMMYSLNENEEEDTIPALTYVTNISISIFSNESKSVREELAVWKTGELVKINETISSAKRFFRIGTAEAIPWSYYRRDIHTGKLELDGDGNPIWEGYCIDFIETLATKLNFDYQLVPPTSGKFGDHDPLTGRWDGVVGDLVSGETDFAVTALKMYSEREEVIDFIAPYFEQTGISIVIRKPVRERSLFKFMTVLRVEVWLSILAALVSTGVILWLIDRYSPYSARNNKEAYPYPCREFTLRESLWFALTSFTPQGGGEAPKAVSSRIMVAAYWLFVVLMLATFTANLAAFLTVERMRTPVQSLEQLTRQSRINYTVVADSDVHQYFINMKFAEDTLYRMWKELVLNATTDFARYRIWDYPIKEQYSQILLAINASNPVRDAAEGFRKVNEHEDSDFAFIHDSAEIKYAVTHNCNFTEVGEVFAEQPYAVAVQQGSHLTDELSYTILELQRDRYFEELKERYWNMSSLQNCPQSAEQEGITLESLGGVFIATLFGLGLAMIILAGEVFYYKRKFPFSSSAIVKVKPAQETVPPSAKKAWSIDEKDLKGTPPPPFETLKFRGQNVPRGITLGGNEFKPRRFDQKIRNQNNDLPPYME